MNRSSHRRPAHRAVTCWRSLLVIAGTALATVAARADRVAVAPPLPAYQQECGACHLAYPPALLPAASWQHLMDNLSQHYGTDASLDAATARTIGAWLNVYAARGKHARETPPRDRITRAGWFVREHREVAPAVWQRPSIKSAAQCGACHGGAEQGRFDEHDIRIPK